jgi:hypothetical protein
MGRVHRMTRETPNSRTITKLIAIQEQQRDTDDTDSPYPVWLILGLCINKIVCNGFAVYHFSCYFIGYTC